MAIWWHRSWSTLTQVMVWSRQQMLTNWCFESLCPPCRCGTINLFAQIPQCTGPISHNAPFCYKNVHVYTTGCIAGHLSGALWDLWDRSISTFQTISVYVEEHYKNPNTYFLFLQKYSVHNKLMIFLSFQAFSGSMEMCVKCRCRFLTPCLLNWKSHNW